MEKKREKIAENVVRLRGRLDKGLCSCITRLFKSNVLKIANKKNLDDY